VANAAKRTGNNFGRSRMIDRLAFYMVLFCALLTRTEAAPPLATVTTADVVVYGGTSAGITAAVQASRRGQSVVIVGPDKHLGGLSSGGLGSTDIGNKQAIGGLSRDFYRRIGEHYRKDEMWKFEPHVAEKVFEDLVAEHEIEVHRNE
jgi:predicted flavoprotein YhiN